MAKTRGSHDEKAWTQARKVCRLNARQVEMARALGMNPKKLPGLRPSPHDRWKLPVSEFIEDRYRKRFGGKTADADPGEPKAGSPTPLSPRADAYDAGTTRDPAWQAQDLTCYLTNLADDLQRWVAHGSIDPDVLSEVAGELREIAGALDAGTAVPQLPAISLPRRETQSTRLWRAERVHDPDDDIPF